MEYLTHSPQETRDLAQKILIEHPGITTIALHGDLGSGKTAFTKGIAQALNILEETTSPTFTLINVYQAHHKHYDELVHVDTYRLNNQADLAAIGLIEYFNKPRTLVVIEWPEKITDMLPSNTLHVFFEFVETEIRKIIL